MPLKYPAEWKFDDFEYQIPNDANNEFFNLVQTIAEGIERPKVVFEDFKSAFGMDSGSSSASWAESDLARAMDQAKDNAARYVASFYAGMEVVSGRGIDVPNVERLNKILAKWEVPLVIEPPNLRLKSGDIEFAASETVEQPSATAFIRGPVIGRGGFGVVYRITRKTCIGEYHFAMKVFNPSPFVQNMARAEARFKREMQALERLQHRGIVQFLEAGLDAEKNPYIMMPYIEGSNLRDALSGAKPDKVFRVFDEILQALEFAHKKGVIHRDLKPNNILVRSSDDQPIILDFGCAYMIDVEDDSLTTTLIGTSAYIPIEVHQDPKHRTVKQDVYSCGVLLYEVIAGRLPRSGEYKPIDGLIDGYEGIDKVIRAALAPEQRRLETAEQMRSELNSIAFGLV
jgi:predicted Ser/Thr protein kinase